MNSFGCSAFNDMAYSYCRFFNPLIGNCLLYTSYQYGKGCLSDGILGSWMTLVCGMPEVVDRLKVKSHLISVHKYNFKKRE